MPLPFFHMTTITATVLDDLGARLPRGYRARAFQDADREPIVEAGNAESHPMERETADEWRKWERMFKDPSRVRLTVIDGTGAVVGSGSIAVGFTPRPDGAQQIGVSVHREHRRRGIGTALLEAFESEAKRRDVSRLLSGTSAARPFAFEFARKHGYREIGRRIMSYRELASFDPAPWQHALARVRGEGIRIRTYAEVLAERDDVGKERLWQEIWDAEGPMWDDIPFSTPTPHWPYDRYYEMTAKNPQLLRDLSLLAYDGDEIVGLTTTGDRQKVDAWTYMTGVARTHRGRGIAMALKVDVLGRGKAKGLRAMCTVNDEPNKAMRGVNIKLGYQPVPDHIELEKRF